MLRTRAVNDGGNAERLCELIFFDGLFIELRSFWTYCARVSQRSGARLWFCVARASPWSRTEHGVAPAYQVLSLRWTEPYGPVCGLVTSCTY
jgi:hypothetical protein